MANVSTVFKTVFSKNNRPLRRTIHNSLALTFVSFFLSLVAFILTILNIVKGKTLFITFCTSFLVIGFIVCGIFAAFKKPMTCSYLLMFLISIVFSFFALTGENDGFAILWILLVPLIAMNLLTLELGFILSLYFQIFLVVIFYSPIKNLSFFDYGPIGQHWDVNGTFLARFPLLYFASFGGTTILALQKEYYFVQKAFQAFTDGLTGVLNRACFINDISKNGSKFSTTFISFDLNGLKYANDTYGHDTGDILIKSTASALKEIWNDPYSRIYRLGGDEFTVVTFRSYVQTLEDVKNFRQLIDEQNKTSATKVSISVGIANAEKEGTYDPWNLNRISDTNMYKDKAQYYSDETHERRKANQNE